ncbi:helix-turn-helix transcriptional regulator [Paenibacillus eucommiae]|uniref:DNA-binding transcriptional regulator YafY n=1 Tax=Paenibacillus eucommiae TaxID=1355755 RepID=A0ABS4JAN0_9BACL|nr:YafY family protein [Paenibacillus eucommiae]MBP1996904.1 putative DNA-binding transcriptional regulator YafY [Paenibacillus eucommiae]
MKLERLMAITILLLNRKRVQAQELADRLEVSLRTIYRDLESLSLAGIPIVSYTGMEGGYEIMDSFRLDRQMLSFDELVTMFTALRGLQSTQALNHSNMDRLLDKVGALVSQAEKGRLADSDHIHIDFTPWKNSEAERNKYEALHKAIKDKMRIRFSYTDGLGGETERCIEPLGLALKGYAWYLHGYCLNREDYRTFKLSRIRGLQILTESFIRRDVELSKLNEPWKKRRTEKTVDAVLRFSGDAKVSAADYFDEHEMERMPDGSVIVRTQLPDGGKWIIGFLLQFRSDLLILEPAHIAAELKKMALEISALYLDSGERRQLE